MARAPHLDENPDAIVTGFTIGLFVLPAAVALVAAAAFTPVA